VDAAELQERLQATLGTAYTLERELGGGGMSRVFVATETTLGRTVVVKVLPPELAHAVSVERFRREIALAAKLQHPHIVQLLAAGQTDGLPYYTMPFVEGESLRDRLTRVGELPLGDVIRIMRDVAGALAYAHERGVVHRDIKPENILLANHHAVVADFGVAKALSVSTTTTSGSTSLTSLGVALGTPVYMAPEQAVADPTIDGRADLYALGTTAYEMLTGSVPFGGRSPQATLAAQAIEKVRPVTDLRPSTPPALAELVMRCLEKHPADRPQSATEVVQALDAIPITPTSGSIPATIARTGRSPWVRWVGGGVVALAIGVVGGLVLRQSRERAVPAGVPMAMGAEHPVTRSVAVLPFANEGRDSTTQYFADGMADELTTALARVPGLQVAARSSAFTFRDQSIGAQEVGQKLHVAAVLEGSVRRAGGKLKVEAQLINTATGMAVWSDSYEREMADVFQVQDELARAIARALYPTLAGASLDTALGVSVSVDARAPRGTSNLAAYDLFLRGRYYFGKGGAPAVWKAIGYFQQAIAADSTFARAYAALAMSYDVLPSYGGARPDSVIPLAEKSAARALALDSTLADAHLALGDVRVHQWRWAEAERELDRSLTLDPSNPTVHRWHAALLMGLGQVDEAVGHAKMAYDLDPLTATTDRVLSLALLDDRQYGEAAASARRGLELDSTIAGLYVNLMEAYLLGGKVDSAVAVADRAVATERGALGVRSSAIWVYLAAGRRADADRLLAEMRHAPSGTVPSLDMAHAWLAFGATDSALAYVTRSVQRHDAEPVWSGLACDPTYDALKLDTRFVALLRPTGMHICPPTDRTPAS
jgi:eukaryotic-like serine/threonine-protein kinase